MRRAVFTILLLMSLLSAASAQSVSAASAQSVSAASAQSRQHIADASEEIAARAMQYLVEGRNEEALRLADSMAVELDTTDISHK